MNVFLNDRLIMLISAFPVLRKPDDLVVEFRDSYQLKLFYKRFEKDETLKRMVLYTDGDLTIMQAAFFSLFTIVEAAGGRVVNEKGEVLVIFRYGRWDLPKGKIIQGEEPGEAAIREVKEETGIQQIAIGKALPSTCHIFRNKGIRILKRTSWFEMTADSGQVLIPQMEEDISIARWMGAAEMDSVSGTTYASLRELFTGRIAGAKD